MAYLRVHFVAFYSVISVAYLRVHFVASYFVISVVYLRAHLATFYPVTFLPCTCRCKRWCFGKLNVKGD